MNQNKLIPYPVLGQNGYKTSTYRGNVLSIKLDNNEYVLKVSHLISNKEIESKIKTGELCCVTSIENTSFYKLTVVHNESNKVFEIKIPRTLIRGRFELDISFKICANRGIHNYSNSDFKEIFSDYLFNFRKGEVLGESEGIRLFFDPGYEKLISNGSFLKFKELPEDQEQMIKFRTYPDHVVFYLPKDLHDDYLNVKKNGAKILLGNLVTPVLMELLSHIRNDPEEFKNYERYSWVVTLKERCGEELEIFDLDIPIMDLVNVILEHPIKQSTAQLKKLLNYIDENE